MSEIATPAFGRLAMTLKFFCLLFLVFEKIQGKRERIQAIKNEITIKVFS